MSFDYKDNKLFFFSSKPKSWYKKKTNLNEKNVRNKSHLLTFAVEVTKYNKNNIGIINKINSQHLTGIKKK